MNIIIALLLMLICALLWKIARKPSVVQVEKDGELSELVAMMKERTEDEERHIREHEMSMYAQERRKNLEGRPVMVTTTSHRDDEPVKDTKHKRAEILIPQNLSAEEKAVLRQFYDL